MAGKRLTGWQSINKRRYYLDANGVGQTGWKIEDNGTKYYLNSATGFMAAEKRVKTDGVWYYFNAERQASRQHHRERL